MKSEILGSQQSIADSRTVTGTNFKSVASGFNQRKRMQRAASFKLSLLSRTSLIVGLFFLIPTALLAQGDTTQTHTVDMATTMRSNGKIYVVVTVLVIILVGIFFYLIRLDRKISKLEKEQ